MSDRLWWGLVAVFCLACVLIVGRTWALAVSEDQVQPSQLSNQRAVDLAVETYDQSDAVSAPAVVVPTGVFIQSIRFLNSSDVNFTGHIWQKYADDVPDELRRGFLFAEQVNSGDTFIEEIFRRGEDGEEVIGWYFDVTVRQFFDYSKYPLDRQNARLRLWHIDFDRQVVLTPDLEAYVSTAAGRVFGLDDLIFPGGWRIGETYFDLEPARYDTNFGIDSFVARGDFPELYFHVVMSRDILDIFVVNIVPLIVVAVLLFGLLMSMTTDEEQSERFGFDNLAVLGATTALLFVVILSHIELRKDFPGSGILYIEYFFFVIYAAIILVSLNAYLFTYRGSRGVSIRYNFMSQIAFWPLLLGSVTALTLVIL